MHFNLLLIPTLLLASLLFVLGFRVAFSFRSMASLVTGSFIAVLASLPALLFVAYYKHFFDGAAWFYSFRATLYSELSAAGVGFGAGLIAARCRCVAIERANRWQKLATPMIAFVCLGVLFVPYAKPLIAPIRRPLHDQWSQGVCLQSSSSTCGPASAATILRGFGIPVSESELARESFSYQGGTENWYVARAMQKHGLQTHYLLTAPEPATLPYPSIAGVQMGGVRYGGHFVTVLGREGDLTIIGDPLIGRLVLTPQQLHDRYYFTGFFLVATRPSGRTLTRLSE